MARHPAPASKSNVSQFSAARALDERGASITNFRIANASGGDDRSITLVQTPAADLPEASRGAVAALLAAFDNVAANSTEWSRDLSPTGLQKKIRDNLAAARHNYREAISLGEDASRALAKKIARYDSLPVDYDGNLEASFRSQFLAADAGQRAAFIQHGSKAALAAILRPGVSWFGVNADGLHDLTVKRYRRLAILDALGMQAAFARVPDLQNPLAGAEPDQIRAHDVADEWIKAWTEERQRIENLGVFLSHYATVAATMLNTRAEGAFRWLAGLSDEI